MKGNQMKTMYKVYENNPELEIVHVVKDTGKTIHYYVQKITIGFEKGAHADKNTLLRTERKEADWYKYFDTPQDAQEWLLEKVEVRLVEALEELNLANKIKNEILDMKL